MADELHRDDPIDLKELVRAVRELTLRLERLERRVDELRGSSVHREPPPATITPFPQRHAGSALESRIGSQWLNRVGVVAVLFGVAYLLRYAFVSNWLSAATWIGLGVCAGMAVVAGSEWFRRRGYRVLSLSLKSTGIGVTYLSLWAALELYKLLTGPEALTGMVMLTALGAVLAVREPSEVLAALALSGAFLAPLLISIPAGAAPLGWYIAVLDLATTFLALRQLWWKLLPLSFLGTILLGSSWYVNHYRRDELAITIVAATFFFAIFCAAVARLRRRMPASDVPGLLAFVEVANPALYFAALYGLVERGDHETLTFPAVCLSTLYFVLARKADRRTLRRPAELAGYGGLGIAFVAVALAMLLPANWLSLGWFLEAAAVMTIGFWRDSPWLRWGALLLLCASVVKAFAYDVWQLGLGYRTLSFIGLGVLLLVMSFAYQRYGFSMITKDGKGPGRPR